MTSCTLSQNYARCDVWNSSPTLLGLPRPASDYRSIWKISKRKGCRTLRPTSGMKSLKKRRTSPWYVNLPWLDTIITSRPSKKSSMMWSKSVNIFLKRSIRVFSKVNSPFLWLEEIYPQSQHAFVLAAIFAQTRANLCLKRVLVRRNDMVVSLVI